MTPEAKVQRNRSLSGFSWLMIGLTVVVFGGAILVVSQRLRQQIRLEMISRDAEILYSVALMQQYELEEQDLLLGSLSDPATQLEIVLKTSRLRAVIAARLFDPLGNLKERFPPTVSDSTLPDLVLESLKRLRPISRFHPNAKLEEVILSVPDPNGEPFPFLEVNIPLHWRNQNALLGIAQFVINGESIAQQFAALDRHLIRQASIIFLVGSALISLVLREAFRRLQRTNRLLSEKTNELLHANKELVLASKTSAIGAVAAHLIHGLKNPLFGLKNLAAQCVQEPDTRLDSHWQTAAATAEQMQAIINEVVRVLQDEQSFVDSHIHLNDLIEVVQARFGKIAAGLGLDFSTLCFVDAQVSHRVANLVLLILQNLIQNAFQASAKGKAVELVITHQFGRVACEVRDQGPGIPPNLQNHLFAPCRSTKPQSTGLGLAISKQIANHLGADLVLKQNGPGGCTFVLDLPENLLFQNTTAFAA